MKKTSNAMSIKSKVDTRPSQWLYGSSICLVRAGQKTEIETDAGSGCRKETGVNKGGQPRHGSCQFCSFHPPRPFTWPAWHRAFPMWIYRCRRKPYSIFAITSGRLQAGGSVSWLLSPFFLYDASVNIGRSYSPRASSCRRANHTEQ